MPPLEPKEDDKTVKEDESRDIPAEDSTSEEEVVATEAPKVLSNYYKFWRQNLNFAKLEKIHFRNKNYENTKS